MIATPITAERRARGFPERNRPQNRVMNSRKDRTVLLSALSGWLWGVFGCFLLSDGTMDARALGGLAVSPFVGIAVGLSSRAVRHAAWWQRCLFALATLFLAASAFAIASALGFRLFGEPRFAGPLQPSIIDALAVVVLGLVMGSVFLVGWALLLWPVAIANHHVIWYLTSGPRDSAPLALNLRG